MPYTCNYCGGRFCANHRLPENHECIGLKAKPRPPTIKLVPEIPYKQKRRGSKKWIGAIAVMVIAGLIIYGVIYYGSDVWDWFEGLGDSGDGDSRMPSISELVNNPAQYNGMNIAVGGDIMLGGGGVEGALWTIWEGDYYIGIVMDLNTSYELGWAETGRVKVTGIFQAPNRIFARRLEKA